MIIAFLFSFLIFILPDSVEHYTEENKSDSDFLILLIHWEDIQCPICFENLIQTAEVLQDNSPGSIVYGLVISVENSIIKESVFQKQVKAWKQANALRFPVFTISIPKKHPMYKLKSGLIFTNREGGHFQFLAFPIPVQRIMSLIEINR
ncbi:hypothetical protein BVY01_04170 [bacterium I07]|nr:hypothetical protein BVY01_04170 [bacterium I07]